MVIEQYFSIYFILFFVYELEYYFRIHLISLNNFQKSILMYFIFKFATGQILYFRMFYMFINKEEKLCASHRYHKQKTFFKLMYSY